MKKVLFTVLAGVLAGMTFVPARAEDDAEKRFEFNGEVRARYEYLNNYLDLTDNDESGDIYDDAYSLAPYRVMLGMTGMFSKNVTGHVDLQYVGHFGDEFNPSKDNPFVLPLPGPLNQGDVPYQRVTQGVQLYQGWVDVGKIGGSDVGVRFGRAEHTYGTELLLGDNDYYSGLSFDGVRGMWQHGGSDLNFFYYKVDEENCFDTAICAGLSGSNDGNFFGATYDWKFKTMGTVGGYVLVSQDLGEFGVTGVPDSKVYTYGARWNRGMMNGDDLNMFDWNIEYAMQSGDFGEPFGGPKTDISGWIGEGWFAFNFKAGETHGRVHIGTLMTSGDDGDTTDKYEGFVSLYGDFHANNRFGDLDWFEQYGVTDATDYNIGYEHWIGANHSVMLTYHMFKLTESFTSFIDGQQHDTFGDEIDFKYGYRYSKNLAFEVTLGQASADEYVFGIPPPDTTDPIQRATVMAKLGW